MTHHYDYAGKTKGERRERGGEKRRERMEQGKKAKLWAKLVQDRADAARRADEEREKAEAQQDDG